MKRIIIVFTLMLVGIAQCQIRGNVKDLSGEALPYVNIYIQNSYTGTTSNAEGQYEINISKPGDYAIVFQFFGFKTEIQNIKVDTFPYRLDVILEDENINLKEVVIDAKENPRKLNFTAQT